MKSLKTIQEGFYKNTKSGLESTITGRCHKIGLEKYRVVDGKVELHQDLIIDGLDIADLGIDIIDDPMNSIIIKNCPNFDSLKGLTGEYNTLLLSNLPKLTTLESDIKSVNYLTLDKLPIKEVELDVAYLKMIDISFCPNITSLSSLPDLCNYVTLHSLPKLKTLKGGPQRVLEYFVDDCNELTNLEGLPPQLNKLTVYECKNINSLKGFPKVIQLDFDVHIFKKDFDYKPFSMTKLGNKLVKKNYSGLGVEGNPSADDLTLISSWLEDNIKKIHKFAGIEVYKLN